MRGNSQKIRFEYTPYTKIPNHFLLIYYNSSRFCLLKKLKAIESGI